MDGQVKEYYIRVMKVPSACESGLVFCSKIKFIDYATLVYSKKTKLNLFSFLPLQFLPADFEASAPCYIQYRNLQSKKATKKEDLFAALEIR